MTSILSYLIKFLFPVYCYGCQNRCDDIVCASCVKHYRFISSKGRCQQCFSEIIMGGLCAFCARFSKGVCWRHVFSPSILVYRILFYAEKGKWVAQRFLSQEICRRLSLEDFAPDLVMGIEKRIGMTSNTLKGITREVANHYRIPARLFFLNYVNMKKVPEGSKVLLLICSKTFSEADKVAVTNKLKNYRGIEFFCVSLFAPN